MYGMKILFPKNPKWATTKNKNRSKERRQENKSAIRTHHKELDKWLWSNPRGNKGGRVANEQERAAAVKPLAASSLLNPEERDFLQNEHRELPYFIKVNHDQKYRKENLDHIQVYKNPDDPHGSGYQREQLIYDRCYRVRKIRKIDPTKNNLNESRNQIENRFKYQFPNTSSNFRCMSARSAPIIITLPTK